ncbi:MAG: peptidylprolyl isomerase [Chloroflexi bacterium]|nr:peptidylprolyl isomerase [Chloroflexota bacterium]MBL7062084.1 peptidylprolyl isomerase [Dehalococcoidia bacterium]
MAKKHIKTELKRSPTKRQLSKWQRQRRIQRIIVIVGAIFFALIVGYIGYGYYDEQVKPLHQPVVKINDTVFDMDYYVKLLEFYSQGKDSTETWNVADELINVIGSGELIRKIAEDLGFGVSADEVNSELRSLGLPDDKVYRDIVSSKLLAAKLLQGYFDPKVPTECEQVQVQAMFLESDEVAEKVIDMLKAGDDFAALAKEYSLEATTKEKGGDLGWLPKDFAYIILGDLGDSLLRDVPFDLEPGELSEPTYDGSVTKGVGYWLVEVTEKDEQKGSHARGILLGSQREAEEIRARVEAGEDFGNLAKEYSQDSESKEQGGDLGWIQIQEGEFNSRVALGLAMQLEPGVVSQPTVDDSALTKGGYWLIKVVDRDDSRALDDETRNTLRLKVVEDLVAEQSKKDSIEVYLTEEQKSWAVDRVLKKR